MNISADSLYHFTRKYDNVESIIKNGFRFNVLEEDVPFSMYAASPFSIPGIIKYITTSKAVCFCDIPLELCREHQEQYGNYVIGLSKEWGIMNGITPIRYIHYYSPDINHDSYRMMKDSYMHYQQHNFFPFYFYARVLKDLGKINEIPTDADINNLPAFAREGLIIMSAQLMDMSEYILFAQSFLRAYEGEWKDRVTNKLVKRRYYDEREWRAVKKIDEQENLKFDFDSITDIIVNTSEEKEKISQYIFDLFTLNDIHDAKCKIKLWENIKKI